MTTHQYIDRQTSSVVDEVLCSDLLVSFLYSRVRENSSRMFKALTSARFTQLLALLRFDVRMSNPARMRARLVERLGLDLGECADPVESLDTARKVFERKIRYWECRPMDTQSGAVSSPADSRILAGSFTETSALFLKDKFFNYDEMLGQEKPEWREAFKDGDFAVFRLTPDRYHFNHVPVSGVVKDIYEIDGVFQSCNPVVVIAQATPYSRNRRTVTIIDTDVPEGSGIGLVAMVEVVALMIGDVVQCYSAERYDSPGDLRPGMFIRRGCPKSLFRPGSSTDVLMFQRGKVRFADDIIANMRNTGASSRYTEGWGIPLVETDLQVRSTIAMRLEAESL